MAEKNVSIRLATVGGEKVKATFVEIGREGSRTLSGLERSGRSSSLALQNVGYQVQDFAVQVASGTAASRALAQQLPQLLSGFGLLGVGLGTAVALFAPFVAGMFESTDAVKSLDEQLSALEKSTVAYQAAARNASIPMDELTAKFGGQAESVRELYDAQFALAQLDLASKQRALRAGLSDAFSDIPNILDQIGVLRANLEHPLITPENRLQTQEAIDGLIDGLGMSEEAAQRVQAALDAFRSADGPVAAAEAMAELRRAILDAAGGYNNLTTEQDKLLTLLVQAQEAAVLFGATDMSGGLRGANAEAQTLVERINTAIDRGARAQDYIKNAKTIGAHQYYAETRMAAPADPVVHPKVHTGGGGGISDAQRERNELMREAERLFDQTRTAAEKYDAELGKLNEMLNAGLINQDTYNRALEDLEEKTKKAGAASNKMRESFEEAFVSMITGAESAADAISNLLAQMAESLAQKGITALFDATGLGGLIEGLFPNAKGNAFDGGNVIPFANGGIVDHPMLFPMKNGTGLMGEAGPEAIVPLSRGRDGKLGIRAQGGGDANVTVAITVNAQGAVAGVAEQVAEAVRAQTPRIVQQTVAAVADARKRGRGRQV